jgi:hypothetical protein
MIIRTCYPIIKDLATLEKKIHDLEELLKAVCPEVDPSVLLEEALREFVDNKTKKGS